MSEELQLGRKVDAASSPEEAVLDRVPNPGWSDDYGKPDVDYVARFTCPEMTSLCPVTGQPDFANVVIDYCPRKWLVESKSLKLFIVSFRNHGAFHEACTLMIAQRLVSLLEPKWLRVAAYWYPRGGIPIDVFYQSGDPPPGLHVPALDVAAYRGRG